MILELCADAINISIGVEPLSFKSLKAQVSFVNVAFAYVPFSENPIFPFVDGISNQSAGVKLVLVCAFAVMQIWITIRAMTKLAALITNDPWFLFSSKVSLHYSLNPLQ